MSTNRAQLEKNGHKKGEDRARKSSPTQTLTNEQS